MPIVALVRHGQASFGAADYDELSPLGRRQAQVVGEELARRGLREPLLVRGTLRRQRDTLSALAGAA
ncbi:MAG: histidine phosphatase family protein, partial [Pseudonocardia sp.]